MARSAPSALQTGQAAFTESGVQGWVQVQVAGGTWFPSWAAAQTAGSAPSAPQTGQSGFTESWVQGWVQVQVTGGTWFPSWAAAQLARSAPSAPQTGQSAFTESGVQGWVQVQVAGGSSPSRANAAVDISPASMASVSRKLTIRFLVFICSTFQKLHISYLPLYPGAGFCPFASMPGRRVSPKGAAHGPGAASQGTFSPSRLGRADAPRGDTRGRAPAGRGLFFCWGPWNPRMGLPPETKKKRLRFRQNPSDKSISDV